MILDDICLNSGKYPIYITNCYDNINKVFSNYLNGTKLLIISDCNVSKLHLSMFIENLSYEKSNIHTYIIENGENDKKLKTVNDIYIKLSSLKFDRKSILIALGGGVVGDITGFVASTYLRGVRYIQVPTSLLSQVDSSVGGKVGVNFNSIKNIIGSFYNPYMVYINTNYLHTLPKREFKSGISEIIIHAIIYDLEFFEYLERNFEEILSLNKEVIKYVVWRNCRIKSDIVQKDENDTLGIRARLNLGHTIGHAIESAANFMYLHGECVAIGTIGALKLSNKLGFIQASEVERVENLFKSFEIPTKIYGLDIEKTYNYIIQDKKIIDEKINFVLPKKIGYTEIMPIDNKFTILEVLNELIY